MAVQKTSEVYTHVYHYTNWKGILGILDTNSLWATHFKFLNDLSEIILFKDTKFPEILYPRVLKKYREILVKNPEIKRKIDQREDNIEDIAKTDVTLAGDILYKALHDQIYIASFCGQSNDDPFVNENGLLSQWRGYGPDGGFALIFETKPLEEMLQKESDKFGYGYNVLCDIVYSSDQKKFEDELSDPIKTIVDFINELTDSLVSGKIKPVPEVDIYHAYLRCISSYKHRGFREENEVRVVTHFPPISAFENKREEKPIKFRECNGEQIPYIGLFESLGTNLPIKKIIVGPHKEKENRKSYLQARLRHTDIEVTVSEIPYSG